MKKAQLVASRTIEKLKDEVVREEQELKDQANKVIEDLRQENIHLLKLYESGQVLTPTTLSELHRSIKSDCFFSFLLALETMQQVEGAVPGSN